MANNAQLGKKRCPDKNDYEQEIPNQRGLLKPTLQITFFSVLGILVSFITQIIIAAKFGTTMDRDAYFAAVVVPGYISAVILGSLTLTFVPIFIEYETKKSKAEAWIVASIFINLTFLVLLAISCIGFIFARQLISVTAPGFEGEELSLTAALLRIILPATIFSGLANLLSSIYYTEHRFFRPAIASVTNAASMLVSVVFLAGYWGIKSLAFGYLMGTVVSFLIVVPILFKGRYHFSFDFRNEGVRQVIRVMVPLVLAGLFYRAGTLIQRMIASTLPTGSISYLGYADRIAHILGGVATLGISTTIFPVMARSWAEKDLAQVREYFAKGIRIIMLITFPIMAIFAAIRVPIIQMVFQRGAFVRKDTLAVANVTLILLAGPFICGGLGNVVWKGFYISQKTKVASLLGVTYTSIYILLAYFLAKSFSFVGLAWASTIGWVIAILMGMIGMKFIYKGINGRTVLVGFGAILMSSVLSGILVFCCFKLLPGMYSLPVRVTTAGGVGLIAYIWLTVYVFKLNEVVSFKTKVLGTLRRRGIATR
ncbi:MAG: murein biosynthesis integral membrane protein MurJ [Desulfobacteraceae bacterium]|nr:murein biosynthesis integral membrane protein MurJ [Desulfobacteraceae bacterium]